MVVIDPPDFRGMVDRENSCAQAFGRLNKLEIISTAKHSGSEKQSFMVSLGVDGIIGTRELAELLR